MSSDPNRVQDHYRFNTWMGEYPVDGVITPPDNHRLINSITVIMLVFPAVLTTVVLMIAEEQTVGLAALAHWSNAQLWVLTMVAVPFGGFGLWGLYHDFQASRLWNNGNCVGAYSRARSAGYCQAAGVVSIIFLMALSALLLYNGSQNIVEIPLFSMRIMGRQ